MSLQCALLRDEIFQYYREHIRDYLAFILKIAFGLDFAISSLRSRLRKDSGLRSF